MDANKVQATAVNVLLDRGVRYKLAEGEVTIRPLRFGTLLVISGMVVGSGLMLKADGTVGTHGTDGTDQMRLFADYGELMLRCVAAAVLNDKDKLTDELIAERAAFYRDNLTAFQVYELFVHVVNLSGIQSFENTIRSLLAMTERNLSPRVQGS